MMWSWIFIGLTFISFISKLHGYSSGNFPEVCESMRPRHGRGGTETLPQTTEPPFMVSYQLGSNVGDPITVSLESKSGFTFRGFMLEARDLSLNGDSPPLGKFIILDPGRSRLLKCGHSQDSAVSNTLNLDKRFVKVNWTSNGVEQDIIFRATFSATYTKYWERVNVSVLRPTSTSESAATTGAATTRAATTPAASTATGAATTATTTATTTTPTGAAVTTATRTTTTSTGAAITTGAATTTAMATATATGAITTTGAATTATITATATAPAATTTKDVITTVQNNKTPATSNTTNESVNILLICLASPLMEMSVQIPIIIMAVHLTTSFCHYLRKKFRIVGSSLSVLFSLATLILSLVYNSEGIIIGLVSAVLAISSTDWIIAMLPLGPSHELNELVDCALCVCFVFRQVFINVFLYVSINSLFEEWGETTRVFWLLIVHTALTIVWNIVLCAKKRTLLHKKCVSVTDKAKHNQHHKGRKEHFSPKGVVIILCSFTLMVLSTSVSVVIFIDYF